jgi:hypothetical protein
MEAFVLESSAAFTRETPRESSDRIWPQPPETFAFLVLRSTELCDRWDISLYPLSRSAQHGGRVSQCARQLFSQQYWFSQRSVYKRVSISQARTGRLHRHPRHAMPRVATASPPRRKVPGVSFSKAEGRRCPFRRHRLAGVRPFASARAASVAALARSTSREAGTVLDSFRNASPLGLTAGLSQRGLPP